MFEEREKPEYSKTNLFFLARRHRFRGNRTRVCWLECLLLPLLHSFFHAPYSLTQLLFYYPTTHFSTFPSPIPNCPPMSLLLYSLLPCFLLFFTHYSSTPFFPLLPISLPPTLPYSPTPSSLSSLFFRFPNSLSLPHHSPTPSSPTLLPPYSSEPLVSALPYSSIRSHLTYCWLYCASATRLLLLPNLMFGISNLKRKLL